MADKPKMLTGYGQFDHKTPGGLFAPAGAIAELMNMEKSDLERLDKDKKLSAKMGQLFNIYNTLWNNMTQWGAAEKPRTTPTHRFLRQAAQSSLVDRLIINARCYQVRHVAHRIVVESKQKGFQVVHKQHSDPNFKITDDIIRRCKEVEEIILHPNPEVHPTGIRDFLVKSVKSEMVIDRKCMVIVRDGGGKPRSFHLLPPDDIKPRYEVLLSMIDKLGFKTQNEAIDHIFKKFQVDASHAAYIQELDGVVYGAWSADEMSVDITNPSDEIDRYGYGESSLELSLEATTLLLMGLNYNKQNFMSNYPEAFLVFDGDVDQQGLEALKRQIYAEVGPQGNQRLPVFSTGGQDIGKAQLLKLRDSLRDMQFLQLLRFGIALKAAAYRAHPSLINFSGDFGKERSLVSNDDQETQLATAQEEGFHSILDNCATWITRVIIEPWYDDLELVWSVEDKPTEMQSIEMWGAKTKTIATVDEGRKANGLQTLEEATDGRLTGEYIADPVFMQAQMMKSQADQQAQMGKMGIMTGPDGAPMSSPGSHDGMEQEQPAPEDGFAGAEPQGKGGPMDLSDLPRGQRPPGVQGTGPAAGKPGASSGPPQGPARPPVKKKIGKSLTLLLDDNDEPEDDE